MTRIISLSSLLILLFFRVLSAGEINVTGQGINIADGDTTPRASDGTDFGQLAAGGGTVTRTFVIQNTSTTSPLFVAGVQQNGAAFSVISGPNGVNVQAGGSVNFRIRFNPTSAGVKNATVTILNNDSNEHPYTFAITGEGLGTPEMDLRGSLNGAGPWITIIDGDTTPLANDGTDFGNADVGGTPVSKTFQIVNSGDAQLTIDSITEGNQNFSISGAPSTVGVNQTKTFTITFDPQSAGTKSTTVTIQNNDPNEDPYTFTVEGEGKAPDIVVRGQGLNIANGDTTPRTSDGTDFGQIAAGGGSVSRTFVIHNEGNQNLSVTSVLETSNAFSITGAPTAATPISPGNSNSFTVTFNPVSAGVRNVTLQIRSNDPATDPFTFTLTGEGLGTPEILVQGQSNGTWVEILDGDPTPGALDGTDFANSTVGGSGKTRTFRIRNTGDAQLTIDSITESSPHFSVSNIPSVAGVNQSKTFDITFAPNSAGTKNATIVIQNNDPDEDPHTFNISGIGRAPDLEVRGQGLLIANGDTTPRTNDGTDFGLVAAGGGSVSRTFVIHNEGNLELNVSSVLENSNAFAISGAPTGATPISPGGSDSFTVTFNPTSAGIRNATLQIRSDDPATDPYSFNLTGEGLGTPEILVQGQLNGTWVEILDGDPSPGTQDGTDFSNTSVGGSGKTHTFRLRNTGEAQLVIDSISENSPHFSVAGAPSVVGVNQVKTFSVTFAPTSSGTHDAILTIENNDPNEDPFTLSLTGVGRAPDLEIRGQGLLINNGDTTPRSQDGTDFGQITAAAGMVTRTFVIHNEGNSELTISAVLENGSAFSINGAPTAATPITPNSSSNFDVVFDPNSAGIKTATIQIRSNDPEKDPYTFSVTGEGLGTPALEVAGRPLVSQPWAAIQNGTSGGAASNGTNFGQVHVTDENATFTYRLANTGAAQITIDSIVSSSAEFSVAGAPDVIGVNQEKPFTITFNPAPGSLNEVSGLITIRSNDPDDDPFTFTVIGTAISPVIQLDGINRDYIHVDLNPPEEEDNRIRGLNDLLSRAGRFAGCALEQINPFDHDNTCWDSGTLFGLPPLRPGQPTYFECVDDAEDLWIISGDTTPAFDDFTYLGEQGPGGYNVNTFEITNTGNTTLTVLGLAVSTDDFRVRSYQLPMPIPPGQCSPIEVVFASYGGAASAVVSIVTDDPVNPLFTFTVGGYGLSGRPGVIVEREDDLATNGRVRLNNSDSLGGIFGPSTDSFDETGINGRSDIRSYWVTNPGDAPLIISTITSSHSAFNVISDITRVEPGDTKDFQIEFDPDDLGSHTATITIRHNDIGWIPAETEFDFRVEGEGVASTPAKPRIAIRSSSPDLHAISNGQTPRFLDGTRIGTIDVGQTVTRTFRVENNGDAPLSISDAVLLGAPNALNGLAASIPPGGFDEFTVTITPTVAGRQFRPIMIGSNDPDQPVHLFWMTALAVEDPVPSDEFRITAIAINGDDLLLSFIAPTGETFRIQSNTDLGSVWNNVPGLTNLPGSGVEQQVTVADGATASRRFFRVRREE